MLPPQPGDVAETYADVTALKAAVGFEPATPIELGVQALRCLVSRLLSGVTRPEKSAPFRTAPAEPEAPCRVDVPDNPLAGKKQMLLVTEEGRFNISELQILCVDRRNGIAGQPFVTLYLLSGEHISGVVEPREPSLEDDLLAA